MKHVPMSKGLIFLLGLTLCLVSCEKKIESGSQSPQEILLHSSKHKEFTNLTENKTADISALADLRKSMRMTDIEFCMVMIPELPIGYNIEEYAVALFDKWKIGRDHKGKGVLYVIVEKNRELKIEVSYELEPYFTDLFCASFQGTIRNYYAGGFFGDVVSNLVNTMVDKYHKRDVTDDYFVDSSIGEISTKYLSGGAGIRRSFHITMEQIREEVKKYKNDDSEAFLPQNSPEGSFENFVSALESGLLNYHSKILTRGSQLMLLEYPKSKIYQQGQAFSYRGAGAFTTYTRGDLAVVRFYSGGYIPVFFRRNKEGLWLVDRVAGAINTGFDSERCNFRLSKNDHVWMFGFNDQSYETRKHPTPALISLESDPLQKIETLSQKLEDDPINADLHFQLAEVFYYECYWLRAAMELCEKGLELEPERRYERHLVLELGYCYPRLDRHEHHYEILLKHYPKDHTVWGHYEWFVRSMLLDEKKADSIRARKEKLFK